VEKTRVKQTDLFEVKSITGRVYEVSEQTMQIMTTFLNGSNTGWLDGTKRYVVISGGSVIKVSENDFFIVASGETATRAG
jgi:hypothetical protein